MIEKKDWTLLVLSAASGATLSPVQLQKALFLFGKNAPGAIKGAFYNFKPYNYGPFDATVYADARTLDAEGLAVAGERPSRSWSEYSITPDGMKRAAEIEAELSPEAKSYLASIVAWVRRVSFEDLLRTVYARYPEYAANSVFNRE